MSGTPESATHHSLLITSGLADCLLNFPGSDAPGADVDATDGSGDDRADALQVRHPAPARHVVGVADPVPEHGCLAADFTHFGHRLTPSNKRKAEIVIVQRFVCNLRAPGNRKSA